MESAGMQLHPKAVEFCFADHVPAWGAVTIHWTGLLDWTTGLDYWTGLLD